MADFSTEAELSLSVPSSELRSAKKQIQDGLGSVSLSVSNQGSAARATSGRGTGRQSRRLFRMARQRTTYAEQAVEHLAGIREEVSEGGGLTGGMLSGLVGTARGAVSGVTGSVLGGLTAGSITSALSVAASSVLAVSGILSIPATSILVVTGTIELTAADVITTSGVLTLGIASVVAVTGTLGLSAAGVLAVTGVVGLSAAAVLAVAGVIGLDVSNILTVSGALAIGAAAALVITGTLTLPAAAVIAVAGVITIGVAEIFDIDFGTGDIFPDPPSFSTTQVQPSPQAPTDDEGFVVGPQGERITVNNQSDTTVNVTNVDKKEILDEAERQRDRDLQDLERKLTRSLG